MIFGEFFKKEHFFEKLKNSQKIEKFKNFPFFSVYIRSKKIPVKFEDDRIKTQGGHELFPPNGKSGPLCLRNFSPHLNVN